ncbi:olfactomedin-4-like [Lissotriton helveticus]
MLLCLLLTATLVQGQFTPPDPKNVTGSVDENGVCLCTVILPDNTFPVERMESLEISANKMNISVQQQITTIQSYHKTLNVYMEKIMDLSQRLEAMEGASYTELEFELLKLEIQEMEMLILQLNATMGGTNVIVHTLYEEIRNISVMVNKLQAYDKNNILLVRREIVSLRERLEECQNHQTKPTPPPSYGTCNQGGLKSVGRPHVIQLNYGGYNSRYGGWGKDSFVNTSQRSLYWVSLLESSSCFAKVIRIYPTLDDMLLYKNAIDKSPKYILQGGGMIMYNNTMYYNCYNKGEICKYDALSNVNEYKSFPNAAFNNRYSYSGVLYQDMDFSADEAGLWVIYATAQSVGDIMIGKVNSTTLAIERTWATTVYKPAVSNAFMICGVLYATRTLNTLKEEIFYMYDTRTSQEGRLNIVIDKMKATVQSLSYNPNDHKLYMFNDGYQVTYEVAFHTDLSQNLEVPELQISETTPHGI